MATRGFKLVAMKGFLLVATFGLSEVATFGFSEVATNGFREVATAGFLLDGIFMGVIVTRDEEGLVAGRPQKGIPTDDNILHCGRRRSTAAAG